MSPETLSSFLITAGRVVPYSLAKTLRSAASSATESSLLGMTIFPVELVFC